LVVSKAFSYMGLISFFFILLGGLHCFFLLCGAHRLFFFLLGGFRSFSLYGAPKLVQAPVACHILKYDVTSTGTTCTSLAAKVQRMTVVYCAPELYLLLIYTFVSYFVSNTPFILQYLNSHRACKDGGFTCQSHRAQKKNENARTACQCQGLCCKMY
jgi:hypothetical protein